MEIIVGSCALQHYNLNRSYPNDIDIWSDFTKISGGGHDYMKIPMRILNIIPTDNGYATPDAVYTIKCSHFAWDIHWQKTKLDIVWLKNNGCVILTELYTFLVEFWKNKNGNKDFLSLSQSKKEFFTDKVTYRYDHDWLHELVAYPSLPRYTKCLKEGEEVLIDKNKFDLMDINDKVRMFKEEIVVIATERWLTNKTWENKITISQAWGLSLKKTITSLTKNWATDFIIFNLDKFVKPDIKMFNHLIDTLKIGKYYMSNVDLTIFEEVMGEVGCDDLSEFLYYLSRGDDLPEVCNTLERDDFKNYSDYRSAADKLLKTFGYEYIEQEGGGEGGSEYCHGVFKLKGKIYKTEYYYYSHHGHDYDNIISTIKEVVPVERVVTVYE